MKEVDEACRELGVAVVGGHTEFSDRYRDPVLCGTLLGPADRVLSAQAIRPGDVVVVTKHVGLEGMTILAADRPDLLGPVLGDEGLREVSPWSSSVSVVPEARILRPWCRFMHDPTEGGFMGGMDELCRLASLGVRLDMGRIPLHPATRKAAWALGFDPLRLISSGVLLAVIPPEHVERALGALGASGIPAAAVGTMDEGGPRDFGMREELWRLLALPAPGR
jgi:hydrogenase maturation factor